MITTCFVNLLSQPRVFLSMSEDGLYCRSLNQVNAKTKVPITATLLTGVGSAIFCGFFSYNYLTAAISLACLLGYGCVCLGAVYKRYENSSYKKARVIIMIVFIVASTICGFSFTFYWHVAIRIGLVAVSLGIMIFYGCLKQSWKPVAYSCPAMPYVPLIGAFCNFFMFGSAGGVSWVIFGIFMLIGVIIYFTFSIKNSRAVRKDSTELLTPPPTK